MWEYVVRQILDISQLQMGDYINLVANYKQMFDNKPEELSERKLRERGYTEKQIQSFLENINNSNSKTDILSLRFKRPLSNFKYINMDYVLLLFENYEKGILPFEGPLGDQPAQIIEVFKIMEHIKNKELLKYQEEALNKSKRGPRGR